MGRMEKQKPDECRDGSMVDQPLQRVDAGGDAVVSHEQLLTYLQQRGGPNACTARLPFDGMNTIVYRMPYMRGAG